MWARYSEVLSVKNLLLSQIPNVVRKLYFLLQKAIHYNMDIIVAFRVIKGQKVLPDGSTLEEHGITDGSTVNIVIEPEKEINLHMSLGSWQFTYKVNNSLRMCDLKQSLIDGGTVGFALNEFQLLISIDGNDEIPDDIPLHDELLPLHLCGVGDNTRLRIICGSIMIQLIREDGERWYKTFPRNMKISQMKQALRSFDFLFHSTNGQPSTRFRTDVMLFLQTGNDYRKLEGEAPIGSVLSDNDVVHLIEDRFYRQDDVIPVYFGRPHGQNIGRVRCVQDDRILSIKLRVQGQMGFPVSRVDVKKGKISWKNDSKVGFQQKPDEVIVS